MLGTLSVVDLRLFEAGLRDQSISQIASDTYPLTMIDLLTVALSGIVLAISEANRLYDSVPFRIKMILFVLALICIFTFHRRLNTQEPSRAPRSAEGSYHLFCGSV
jgi:hypothetical protein